jgi:hypothetical protein
MAVVVGSSPIPFLRNASLSQPAVVSLSYTFLGSESVGTYFAFAGLAASGTDPSNPANRLSLASGMSIFALSVMWRLFEWRSR